MVRNVVKFTAVRKMRYKKSRGQTGSTCVLWPTFDLNSVTVRDRHSDVLEVE